MTIATAAVANRGVIMGEKSKQKSPNDKKVGKTLKEKRAAKRAKQEGKSGIVPPSGH
ncbi:MAG: hypothetical protein WCB04_11750 [Mycobacteriales bacterium]